MIVKSFCNPSSKRKRLKYTCWSSNWEVNSYKIESLNRYWTNRHHSNQGSHCRSINVMRLFTKAVVVIITWAMDIVSRYSMGHHMHISIPTVFWLRNNVNRQSLQLFSIGTSRPRLHACVNLHGRRSSLFLLITNHQLNKSFKVSCLYQDKGRSRNWTKLLSSILVCLLYVSMFRSLANRQISVKASSHYPMFASTYSASLAAQSPSHQASSAVLPQRKLVRYRQCRMVTLT